MINFLFVQVSIPLGFHDKCPISVSLVARHFGDRFLLDIVQSMYATLQEQADAANSKPGNAPVSQENTAEISKEKVCRNMCGGYVVIIHISEVFQCKLQLETFGTEFDSSKVIHAPLCNSMNDHW